MSPTTQILLNDFATIAQTHQYENVVEELTAAASFGYQVFVLTLARKGETERTQLCNALFDNYVPDHWEWKREFKQKLDEVVAAYGELDEKSDESLVGLFGAFHSVDGEGRSTYKTD